MNRVADKIADKSVGVAKRAAWKGFILCGERGRNRTFNLLIKSQLLCQLSYAPAMSVDVGPPLGVGRP